MNVLELDRQLILCSRVQSTAVSKLLHVKFYISSNFYAGSFIVVGVLVFFVFGYALAWGDGNSFIGWNNFALAYIPGKNYFIALNRPT